MFDDAHQEFRKLLVDLYPDKNDCRRACLDAGLSTQYVDFDGAIINAWNSAVNQASQEHKLHRLVGVAREQFGDSPELQRLQTLASIMQAQSQSLEALPLIGILAEPPFTVPFLPNRDFVGRELDLQHLHQAMTGNNPVGVTGLTGMGGIGKTQLAVAYAYQYRDAYPGGVFWINAAEPLLHGFADQACRLNPEVSERPLNGQVRVLAQYLRNSPDSLLILDNVADPSALKQPVTPELVPAALSCAVMFTTRHRALGHFTAIEMTVLPEEPSLQLLLRHKRRQPARRIDHPEHDEAKAICRLLGYLPLALEIAGAFIGEWPEVSLADFRLRLRQEGRLATLDEEGEELSPANLPAIHKAAVAATLREQWQTLKTGHRVDKDASLVLRVAGQLPEAAQIPLQRLALLAGLEDDLRPGRPSKLDRALRRLEQGSLVEELREQQVRLHPLVWEFAADLTTRSEVAAFRASCAANLAERYRRFPVLESQCARRGVRALEDDMLAALQLIESASRGVSTYAGYQTVSRELRTLLICLQREAHVLAGWQPEKAPALFAQQVCKRAASIGHHQLARSAVKQLEETGVSFLEPLWQNVIESPILERTLQGHEDGVWAVAITPDGRRAVSACDDGTLKVWDLASGREERTLQGHRDWVTSVAITPDNRRAVSASWDRTIKVWDLASGRDEHTFHARGDVVWAVAVTPDGHRIVYASDDGTFQVWNLANGREDRILHGHRDRVLAVAVTFDGRHVISASADRTIKVWDLASGREERTLQGHGDWVWAVAVTPDGCRAVSASADCTLKVWDLLSGREKRTLQGHEGEVRAVAITPDGRRAVSASWDRSLKVWDLASGRETRTLQGHGDRVWAVAITPDGRRAVSTSDDHTLKVWDISTEADSIDREVRTLQGHHGAVSAVVITSDGRQAVTACVDRTLKVWNLASGSEERTLQGHEGWVLAVAVTPDGRRAVSASADRTLKVWNLASGREEHTLLGHGDWVRAVAITPDGHLAVSASWDRSLKVWDLVSGREVRTLHGHGDSVWAVAITPDGRRVVSASWDHNLKLWDLVSGREERTLQGHGQGVYVVAVIPDGHRAVSASADCTLRIWDLASGCEERTIQSHGSALSAVAVTVDGRYVVSASIDGVLKVWDIVGNLDTCSREDAMAGQGSVVSVELDASALCVAVAPDGKTVVAGDASGNVYCFALKNA